MSIMLVITAVLLVVAIAVQVMYARAYAPNATRSVKIVWGVNIGLLVVVLLGIVWYAALGPGAS